MEGSLCSNPAGLFTVLAISLISFAILLWFFKDWFVGGEEDPLDGFY